MRAQNKNTRAGTIYYPGVAHASTLTPPFSRFPVVPFPPSPYLRRCHRSHSISHSVPHQKVITIIEKYRTGILVFNHQPSCISTRLSCVGQKSVCAIDRTSSYVEWGPSTAAHQTHSNNFLPLHILHFMPTSSRFHFLFFSLSHVSSLLHRLSRAKCQHPQPNTPPPQPHPRRRPVHC